MRFVSRIALLASFLFYFMVLVTGVKAQLTSGPFSYSIGLSPTEINHVFHVDKFDSSLGNLIEVDLSFATGYDIHGTITNTGSPDDFTVTARGDLLLADASNTLLSTSYSISQDYPNLGTNDTKNFSNPDGSHYTADQSASGTYTSGSTFNEFNGGPGTVDLTYTSQSHTDVLGGSNYEVDLAKLAKGTVTVSYKYLLADAPEPGSVALFCGMLVSGVFVTVRRRGKMRGTVREESPPATS